MRAFHGLLTSISALVILLLSASWLGEKYDVGPDLGLWAAPNSNPYQRYAKQSDGVPATGKGEISVPLNSFFGRAPWDAQGGATIVLPVSYGRNDFGSGFTTYMFGGERSRRSGGSCSEKTVNLLVVNQEKPAGEPVFESRVFLPRYFHFEDAGGRFVFALVVRNDTNGDGQLDCGDIARFELISLADGSKRIVDHDFIPDDLSRVSFRDNDDAFVFTELKYVGEDISITSVSVLLQDLSVKEVAAPDLLSKAKEAFENTAHD
jgi:hypothetical protein